MADDRGKSAATPENPIAYVWVEAQLSPKNYGRVLSENDDQTELTLLSMIAFLEKAVGDKRSIDGLVGWALPSEDHGKGPLLFYSFPVYSNGMPDERMIELIKSAIMHAQRLIHPIDISIDAKRELPANLFADPFNYTDRNELQY